MRYCSGIYTYVNVRFNNSLPSLWHIGIVLAEKQLSSSMAIHSLQLPRVRNLAHSYRDCHFPPGENTQKAKCRGTTITYHPLGDVPFSFSGTLAITLYFLLLTDLFLLFFPTQRETLFHLQLYFFMLHLPFFLPGLAWEAAQWGRPHVWFAAKTQTCGVSCHWPCNTGPSSHPPVSGPALLHGNHNMVSFTALLCKGFLYIRPMWFYFLNMVLLHAGEEIYISTLLDALYNMVTSSSINISQLEDKHTMTIIKRHLQVYWSGHRNCDDWNGCYPARWFRGLMRNPMEGRMLGCASSVFKQAAFFTHPWCYTLSCLKIKCWSQVNAVITSW